MPLTFQDKDKAEHLLSLTDWFGEREYWELTGVTAFWYEQQTSTNNTDEWSHRTWIGAQDFL